MGLLEAAACSVLEEAYPMFAGFFCVTSEPSFPGSEWRVRSLDPVAASFPSASSPSPLLPNRLALHS